jgi:hypothetical protein
MKRKTWILSASAALAVAAAVALAARAKPGPRLPPWTFPCRRHRRRGETDQERARGSPAPQRPRAEGRLRVGGGSRHLVKGAVAGQLIAQLDPDNTDAGAAGRGRRWVAGPGRRRHRAAECPAGQDQHGQRTQNRSCPARRPPRRSQAAKGSRAARTSRAGTICRRLSPGSDRRRTRWAPRSPRTPRCSPWTARSADAQAHRQRRGARPAQVPRGRVGRWGAARPPRPPSSDVPLADASTPGSRWRSWSQPGLALRPTLGRAVLSMGLRRRRWRRRPAAPRGGDRVYASDGG